MPRSSRKPKSAAADSVVQFVRLLKHTKGKWAGRRFELQPWQEGILRDLFGTVRADGLRQYRTGYISLGRKNGKSELLAAIALYMLIMDGEAGAEVYSAAADREQAALVFNAAAQMVRQSPDLSGMLRIIDSQKRIIHVASNSVYHAVSSEAHSKHGYSASCVVYDELHSAPNRDLWDVLATSMGAREQPLMLAITTAGFDRETICYEQYRYAKDVQAGLIDDPSFYAYIAEAGEQDDWEDERVWKKANPNLGVSISEEFLRSEFKRAKEIAAYQNTFRRLYLNQWTQAEDRWFDLSVWDACGGLVIEDKYEGRKAFGGLDLSSTSDFSAWIIVVPEDDGTYVVIPRLYLPEAAVHKRSRMTQTLEAWAREGIIRVTPGDVIDYQRIKRDILQDCERFQVQEVGYDPWNATGIGVELEQELMHTGMVPVRQGFATMSAPAKLLETLIHTGKLNHGGNACLRWMADNCTVETDAAENIKPSKKKSTEKVDGIVALCVALERAMHQEEPGLLMYIPGEEAIRA